MSLLAISIQIGLAVPIFLIGWWLWTDADGPIPAPPIHDEGADRVRPSLLAGLRRARRSDSHRRSGPGQPS
jgi:hypothetical protein